MTENECGSEGETKTRQRGIDDAIDKNQQNAGNKLDVSFADGLTAAQGGMPVQQGFTPDGNAVHGKPHSGQFYQ